MHPNAPVRSGMRVVNSAWMSTSAPGGAGTGRRTRATVPSPSWEDSTWNVAGTPPTTTDETVMAAGLNPRETSELAVTLRRVRERFHVTVLLIEHDMRLVMNLCERVVVLDYGKVIAAGPPERVKADPAVIEAYLGKPREGEGAAEARRTQRNE